MEPQHLLASERIYLDRLRKMSGEERLMIADGLYNLSIEIAKAGIRQQNPDIPDLDLKKELLRRIYKDESYRYFINGL